MSVLNTGSQEGKKLNNPDYTTAHKSHGPRPPFARPRTQRKADLSDSLTCQCFWGDQMVR